MEGSSVKARLRILLVALSLAACGDEEPPPDDSHIALEQQQGQYGWGPERCAAPPAGTSVGYARLDQMGPLSLKSCGGATVTLSDVCGADATWLYFVHMWCPSCQQLGAMSEAIADDYATRNVASINIVVEDFGGQRPDEEDCRAWREKFGQQDVITLFDPNGDSFVMWEQPYTSLNAVLDDKQVIKTKVHTAADRDIRWSIESRLLEAAAD